MGPGLCHGQMIVSLGDPLYQSIKQIKTKYSLYNGLKEYIKFLENN